MGTMVDTFQGEMGLIHPAAKPIIEDMLAQRGVVSISDFTPSEASAFLELLADFCLDIDEDVLRERFTFFRERYGCVLRDEVRTEVADWGEAAAHAPHAAPSQQDAEERAKLSPRMGDEGESEQMPPAPRGAGQRRAPAEDHAPAAAPGSGAHPTRTRGAAEPLAGGEPDAELPTPIAGRRTLRTVAEDGPGGERARVTPRGDGIGGGLAGMHVDGAPVNYASAVQVRAADMLARVRIVEAEEDMGRRALIQHIVERIRDLRSTQQALSGTVESMAGGEEDRKKLVIEACFCGDYERAVVTAIADAEGDITLANHAGAGGSDGSDDLKTNQMSTSYLAAEVARSLDFLQEEYPHPLDCARELFKLEHGVNPGPLQLATFCDVLRTKLS